MYTTYFTYTLSFNYQNKIILIFVCAGLKDKYNSFHN